MIRNNLAVLLAQKEVKISRMALDTGLSRTTLTSISQNESKRIDNETLNTILMYLQISPNQFFNFIPYDFDINIEVNNFVIKNTTSEQDSYENRECYTLEAGDFDLFIKLDDKISERLPIYEFEIKLEEHYNKIQIEEVQEQVDYNTWETHIIDKGKFVFNLVSDDTTIEKFNMFILNKVSVEFQKEIQKTIEQKFKSLINIQIKEQGFSSQADYICDNFIDIASPNQILNFLPF